MNKQLHKFKIRKFCSLMNKSFIMNRMDDPENETDYTSREMDFNEGVPVQLYSTLRQQEEIGQHALQR